MQELERLEEEVRQCREELRDIGIKKVALQEEMHGSDEVTSALAVLEAVLGPLSQGPRGV